MHPIAEGLVCAFYVDLAIIHYNTNQVVVEQDGIVMHKARL